MLSPQISENNLQQPSNNTNVDPKIWLNQRLIVYSYLTTKDILNSIMGINKQDEQEL